MCGRFAAASQAEELAQEFDVDMVSEAAAERPASWNVAPTDPVRIVLDRPAPPEAASDAVASPSSPAQRTRELHLARWGLLPPWSKGPAAPGPPMFNARVETAAQKKVFAPALRGRRCLVPADGYYEWRVNPPESGLPRKTPFFIHTEASLAFAGLYSWWRDPARAEEDPDRWVLSTTILTRPAAGALADIHDREPIVLAPDVLSDWLDPAAGSDEALAVLQLPGPDLRWYEVANRVGSVRNDDPGLIEPI